MHLKNHRCRSLFIVVCLFMKGMLCIFQVLFIEAPREAEKTIFQSHVMKYHPQVALLGTVRRNEGIFLASRYNPYSNSLIPYSTLELERASLSLDLLFKPFPMSGHPLRVSCMPYGYLASAEEDTSPRDPRKRWSNYIGFQVLNTIKTSCL